MITSAALGTIVVLTTTHIPAIIIANHTQSGAPTSKKSATPDAIKVSRSGDVREIESHAAPRTIFGVTNKMAIRILNQQTGNSLGKGNTSSDRQPVNTNEKNEGAPPSRSEAAGRVLLGPVQKIKGIAEGANEAGEKLNAKREIKTPWTRTSRNDAKKRSIATRTDGVVDAVGSARSPCCVERLPPEECTGKEPQQLSATEGTQPPKEGGEEFHRQRRRSRYDHFRRRGQSIYERREACRKADAEKEWRGQDGNAYEDRQA